MSRHRSSLLRWSLLCTLLVLPAVEATAQQPDTARTARIAAVRSLRLGRLIRLTRMPGARVEGIVTATSDTMVTLQWGDSSVSRIPVVTIAAIDRRGRSTARGALWGGGIGLVAGFAYGLLIGEIACSETDCTRAEVGAVVGGLGAVSGAVLGAGIGFAIPRWRRVFP